MQCGSASSITKLLRELSRRDIAIKAAEHETRTRQEREDRQGDFRAIERHMRNMTPKHCTNNVQYESTAHVSHSHPHVND